MKRSNLVLLLIVALLPAALAVLQAKEAREPDSTSPATQPQPIGLAVEKWILHPSLISKNPLQYTLLPNSTQQTPGNAAQLYLEAGQFLPDNKTSEAVLYPENRRYDFLCTPIDEFPQQYAHKLLDTYSDTLAMVDRAARRKSAVWDDDWPDPALGSKPLEYNDELRHYANLLSFRARYQASQRDWTAADYTLQTSFSMAKQFGGAPMLIHAIDEGGFGQIALSGVEEWIRRGNSPNLYWVLTNLPCPFVDVAPIAQCEREPVGQTLLDQAYRGNELSPEQWSEAVREMIGRLREAWAQKAATPAEEEAEATRVIDSAFPRARQYLISNKESEKKIDAMTRAEVVGIYFCREALTASDALWKCWGLPFPQAREQMLRSWRAMAPDRPPLLENPLFQAGEVLFSGNPPHAHYDVPSLLFWRYTLIRVDREIAMLRTIEALRDYAARHDGRPPDYLDQVTDLPIPMDPVTGKLFPYSVQQQTVHLEATPPWSSSTAWRIEITFSHDGQSTSKASGSQ